MGYIIALTAQSPGKDIVGHIGPEVPDMGIVIYRGPAAVKTGLTGRPGLKNLQFPSQGIE
jgi:hypothetical protein